MARVVPQRFGCYPWCQWGRPLLVPDFGMMGVAFWTLGLIVCSSLVSRGFGPNSYCAVLEQGYGSQHPLYSAVLQFSGVGGFGGRALLVGAWCGLERGLAIPLVVACGKRGPSSHRVGVRGAGASIVPGRVEVRRVPVAGGRSVAGVTGWGGDWGRSGWAPSAPNSPSRRAALWPSWSWWDSCRAGSVVLWLGGPHHTANTASPQCRIPPVGVRR
jgi:hypothetical protein